ncbi:MAG: DUF4124 domain-containing protein [Desulforhopalus sp.]|nr:DUF4124 domain-containing protein [Desulforhopalus sp.]
MAPAWAIDGYRKEWERACGGYDKTINCSLTPIATRRAPGWTEKRGFFYFTLTPKNMKTYIQILLLFFVLSAQASAEMYTWVDENGKTQFSNTIPPPGTKAETIKDDTNITASSKPRETRPKEKDIRQRYDQSIATIERNHQKALDRIENDRIEGERQELAGERRSLDSKKKRWLERCEKETDGYVNESDCRDHVNERFDVVFGMISRTPKYYLDHRHSIDGETDKLLKAFLKKKQSKNRHSHLMHSSR